VSGFLTAREWADFGRFVRVYVACFVGPVVVLVAGYALALTLIAKWTAFGGP
jgi:hypothetical protein